MTDRRQKIVLSIALFGLLAVLWSQLGPSVFSGSGGGTGLVGGDRRKSSRATVPGDEVVELAALEKSSHTYRPGRDPFRFGERPKPPPPKAVVVPPKPPPPPPVQRAAVRPAKPQPPPIELNFLGSFGPDRARIAVFTDGQSIYNARIGEVVDSKFIVSDIGFESVDLAFVEFPNFPAQKLPLGG